MCLLAFLIEFRFKEQSSIARALLAFRSRPARETNFRWIVMLAIEFTSFSQPSLKSREPLITDQEVLKRGSALNVAMAITIEAQTLSRHCQEAKQEAEDDAEFANRLSRISESLAETNDRFRELVVSPSEWIQLLQSSLSAAEAQKAKYRERRDRITRMKEEKRTLEERLAQLKDEIRAAKERTRVSPSGAPPDDDGLE
jgi:Mg2+ and Co2+ transporter CorA